MIIIGWIGLVLGLIMSGLGIFLYDGGSMSLQQLLSTGRRQWEWEHRNIAWGSSYDGSISSAEEMMFIGRAIMIIGILVVIICVILLVIGYIKRSKEENAYIGMNTSALSTKACQRCGKICYMHNNFCDNCGGNVFYKLPSSGQS